MGELPFSLDESSLHEVRINRMFEKANVGELPSSLDESSLHEVRINRIFEKENGVFIDLDDAGKECGFNESNSRIKNLFDEALGTFLSERSGRMSFRPLPVSCSDGRHVDLFKLFWVVRKLGGYDLVCSKYLWDFVVEQCDLRSGVSAFLKLIYVTYLKEFDHWLCGLNIESNDIHCETGRKLNLLLQELEPMFKVSLMSKVVGNKIEGRVIQLTAVHLNRGAHMLQVGDVLGGSSEGSSDDKYDYTKHPTESEKELVTSRKRGFEEVTSEVCDDEKQWLVENGGKASPLEDSNSLVSAKRVRREFFEVQKDSESDINYEQDVLCAPSNANLTLSAKNDLEEDSDSQKQKRESFSFTNLMDWIRHVAKHSDDPRIGEIPKCSKWNNHVWLQALVVRKARFLDKNTRSRDFADPLQMKLWTDVPTYSGQTKSRTLCCKECFQDTVSGDKEKERAPKRSEERNPKERKDRSPDRKQVSERDGIEYKLSYKSRTHDLLVGSEFQAEVPEWTGNISESDSKWLGTKLWPPEDGQRKSPLSLLSIGRGRQFSCDCPLKNSVECVRFHIAEKRFLLKIELGSLFFEWRFNRMGEEVSLSWTPEEEDKFKEVVNSNTENLWKKLARMFPSKTREMLVSYYFNVYMNQVRCYQNRTTPKDIDSDGEEQQYGTIGERFGYKALRAPISSSLVCIENKQCFEFQ
ncbi:hypothetical protein LIER_02490 [Lithospermum erythrorhizon]|uniref:Uncharacterized protein n=1 Tax=Lithospermum erythrorhizon TaxID=34254 RepID=A0AAV3NQ25_LITER